MKAKDHDLCMSYIYNFFAATTERRKRSFTDHCAE